MMEEIVISKRCAVKYTLTWWKDPLSMQDEHRMSIFYYDSFKILVGDNYVGRWFHLIGTYLFLDKTLLCKRKKLKILFRV